MRRLRPYTAHLIYTMVSLTSVSTIIPVQGELRANDEMPQIVTTSHLVRFANDNLSVRVENMSLHELLDEIARQSDLTVVRYVALDERMTLEFHKLSLDEGLRRILRSRSFVLAYVQLTSKEAQSAIARPMTLWVLPQGGETSSIQDPLVSDMNVWASGEELATAISPLHAALSSEAAEDREEAVVELGESSQTEALASLTLALVDESEDVREAAIVVLAEIGGAEATQALAIALGDENPKVRAEAVEALGEIGGKSAIGLLKQALADHEHIVREAATEILDQLQVANQ